MRFLFPAAFLALSSLAGAATLSRLGPSATNVSTVDLTATGTANWALWNSRSSPDTTPGADFFMSPGATGTISPMSPTTGSIVRGTDNTSSYPSNVFSWSNGNNNTVPGQITGMFTTVDQINVGVKFTITDLPSLAAGQTYQINLYGSAYRGTNEVTASIGSLSQTITGTLKAETKAVELYQFFYNPDQSSDVLTLSSILTVDNGSAAHALIYGVAISVIPEPSQLLLTAAGLLGLLGIRRR